MVSMALQISARYTSGNLHMFHAHEDRCPRYTWETGRTGLNARLANVDRDALAHGLDVI